MSKNTANTTETTENITPAVDDFGGATVTLPLAKLCQLVNDLAVQKTENAAWYNKYWTMYAEKESLKKQLEELGRES